MRVISALALAMLLLSAATAASPDARNLVRQAEKAERAGDLTRAYLLFSQAVTQEPYNLEYWRRQELLRVPVTLGASPREPIRQEAKQAAPLAPEREPLPPPTLQALPDRLDFELRGDARALFTKVAAAYKLEVMFDSDYQAGPAIQFRAEKADYREALRALELATNSFVTPAGERRLLVARDTAQKRQELEPVVSVAVPVPAAYTAQEAQDVMRALQQAFALTRVSYDSQHSVILIRDRLSRVRPAQELAANLVAKRTVVSIQLEFVEQARNSSLTYGADLQSLFPLVDFGAPLNFVPSIPAGFARFVMFGGGATLLGVGLADARAFAQQSRSTGFSLFSADLRSLDGEQASLHVGDRFPIVTGKYTSTDASSQMVFPPAINFEDLGLSLQIKPRVHDAREVTLDLTAEFKALTGQVIDDNPVIVNRKLQSTVRLRAGQWAVVAGLMNSSQARTISGLAGLSRIPVIGKALRRNNREDAASDVLLVLKPVILSVQDTTAGALAVGSEARPRMPL